MFKRMQSMQMQAVHCFQTMGPDQHEYRAIIALHNTHLGPALGGCRCLEYANEQLAFDDAMRLAQGMSYKAALANIPQGGGKSVILLPNNVAPEQINRQFLFTWFGQCVEQLQGQYITAMDVGTQVADMDTVAQQTRHVASASNIGDPASATADGVIAGIKAAIDSYFNNLENTHYAKVKSHALTQNIFSEKTFAVQGLGHVGWRVAKALHYLGGRVIAADPDVEKCLQAEALGIKIVPTDKILIQPCDVLVPCALGGIIHADNVRDLRCKIIAGSANNQLADNEVAEVLDKRGILYTPDYVINAGGLIFASMQYNAQGQSVEDINDKVSQKIAEIYSTLSAIFQQAKASQKNVNQVANELAQQRIRSIDGVVKPSKGDVYDAA
ncbi:MAG: Glu/Leu/Phe/Val dehydrogenase dimerization domain-containing protein [Oleispira sp.]